MSLDFINSVESGIKHLDSGDWLHPASVQDLTDTDFVTLPPAQRDELFLRAGQFRTITESPLPVDAAQEEAARGALKAIWDLLRPYRTPESKTIREVLWSAWNEERAQNWVPTFDYRLGEDWSGDPAVWVWLILNDDADITTATTRERVRRFQLLIRARLQDAGIDRWPYVETRARSDAKWLAAKVPA